MSRSTAEGGLGNKPVALAVEIAGKRKRKRERESEIEAPQRQRVEAVVCGTVRVEWGVGGTPRHALAGQKLVRLAAALWASRRAETKKMAAVHGGNVAIV